MHRVKASGLKKSRHLRPVAPWTAALATVLSFALARCPEVAAQTAAASPEARQHFEAGVRHLRSQSPDRYQLAYREFKAAYAASPTWKILGNLGIAAQQLERYGEAIDAFEQYLVQGRDELHAPEREQVQRDLDQLRAEQATITIDVTSGPVWIIDTRVVTGGSSIVNEYGPFDGPTTLRVKPGLHDVRVEHSGTETPPWSVTLLPGDTATHAFEMDEDENALEPEQLAEVVSPQVSAASSPTDAYVLWGIGAAAAVATAVVYLHAASIQSSANAAFDRNCPNGVVPSDANCTQTTAGDAKAANWRTGALIVGAAGLTSLISGTVLYVLDRQSDDSRTRGGNVREGGRPLRLWADLNTIGVQGAF